MRGSHPSRKKTRLGWGTIFLQSPRNNQRQAPRTSISSIAKSPPFDKLRAGFLEPRTAREMGHPGFRRLGCSLTRADDAQGFPREGGEGFEELSNQVEVLIGNLSEPQSDADAGSSVRDPSLGPRFILPEPDANF